MPPELFVPPVRPNIQLAPPELKKGEELVPPVRPNIYRATAAEADGEVVIRLSCPSLRSTEKDAQRTSVYVWEKRKEPLTLGKDVKAYSQAGKPLSKEAVLNALAKPVAVICFVRDNPDRPGAARPILHGHVPGRRGVAGVPRQVTIARK